MTTLRPQLYAVNNVIFSSAAPLNGRTNAAGLIPILSFPTIPLRLSFFLVVAAFLPLHSSTMSKAFRGSVTPIVFFLGMTPFRFHCRNISRSCGLHQTYPVLLWKQYNCTWQSLYLNDAIYQIQKYNYCNFYYTEYNFLSAKTHGFAIMPLTRASTKSRAKTAASTLILLPLTST